ncbi:hypothetical protein EVAR_38235_1 [Eumeta japonica]|uniref:Uncharacterized protein n=1 Tax=Eumeta variegata TaxID=151549 RepID=A0A4C1XGC6_EUMVA|nr:hypothetical protein EVAR_38235_1 [Eumeta japonica]
MPPLFGIKVREAAWLYEPKRGKELGDVAAEWGTREICPFTFDPFLRTSLSLVYYYVQCSFEPRSGVSGFASVRVCVVPRSVHRVSTVKLRVFVPCVHSGLLHRLHVEPAPGFCA